MTTYAAGVVAAILIIAVGVLSRMDRERSFYAVTLIVIASYYVLFAAMASSPGLAVIEAGIAAMFGGAAIVGFRYSRWIVAVALGLHGVFDFAHGQLLNNTGVPDWWPAFCLTVDVLLGLYVAWQITSQRDPSRDAQH